MSHVLIPHVLLPQSSCLHMMNHNTPFFFFSGSDQGNGLSFGIYCFSSPLLSSPFPPPFVMIKTKKKKSPFPTAICRFLIITRISCPLPLSRNDQRKIQEGGGEEMLSRIYPFCKFSCHVIVGSFPFFSPVHPLPNRIINVLFQALQLVVHHE